MKHQSELFSNILSRLNAVRKKENRLDLLYGAMLSFLGGLVFVFLAMLLDIIFMFNTFGRTVLVLICLISIGGLVIWYVVRPLFRLFGLLKSTDNHTLALRVGNYFPSIRDRLLDAIQLYENRESLSTNYSLSLIDASFTDLAQQIEGIKFTDAVSNSRVKKMGKYLFSGLLLVLITFIFSPVAFITSASRLINYNKSFAIPQHIVFYVEPGNIEAVRGENIPIIIKTSPAHIKQVNLLLRPEGQLDFDKHTLLIGKDGAFRTTIENIKISTEYFAEAEDVSSERFKINVSDRPLIRSLQINLVPPAYTRLPKRALEENIGEIYAYAGTNVEFNIVSSKELSTAEAVFNNGSCVKLQVKGHQATGKFVAKQNCSYHFNIEDLSGLKNINPVEYELRIIPDEYPQVEILSPARNLDITEQMKLDLLIRIKDDFGFSKLQLAHRLIQSRFEPPEQEFTLLEIPLPPKTTNSFEFIYQWDFSSFKLVPEDVVAYYLEVFDNDAIKGPKSGRSEMFLIRLPSLEEVFTDISQVHHQSLESMRSIAQEAQQMKKDIEELNRELKKSKEKTDWQQQKKAYDILKRFEGIKKKLEETTQKIDDMLKQMEDHKLLSQQTLEKYLELQKLMEQLKSPELQEALKKLQESIKNLSPEQLRQAMQQMQFSEEQFRKSLERTIELLKRIHIEQKIDELIKRTEELIKQQDALKQEAQNISSQDIEKREELAQKQQGLKEQLDALERETSELQRKMEEFPKDMPLDEMAKAQETLQQHQLGQKMATASQQMKSGNIQQCQQNQQATREGLKEFLEQMKVVQKSLFDQQMKQIVNEMRKQLQNLIELSKRQEELKDETSKMEPNSMRFRESAQEQMDLLNSLENVADAMSQVAKKTFAISPEMGREIGNALQKMNEAIQQMEIRNPSTTSQRQQESMGSLNRAAMMMQDAISSMMQGGKGGMGMAGLMSRLNQMTGMQSGINIGTKQAMGMGDGQGLTPQQMAEYQRLAAQQGAVQKSLEQLAQEAKFAGEFSKLLGDLERIAEDMKEVQTDLEQGEVNPETIQKQERILSRLLDSQRSMRERDYEKRRRADVGKPKPRLSPAEIDLTTQEGKNKLREELLKAIEGKYSKDYEELIRKYFEQLEKEEIHQ